MICDPSSFEYERTQVWRVDRLSYGGKRKREKQWDRRRDDKVERTLVVNTSGIVDLNAMLFRSPSKLIH